MLYTCNFQLSTLKEQLSTTGLCSMFSDFLTPAGKSLNRKDVRASLAETMLVRNRVIFVPTKKVDGRTLYHLDFKKTYRIWPKLQVKKGRTATRKSRGVIR